MKHRILLILTAFLIGPFPAFAQMDKHDNQALQKTQGLLKDQKQRDAFIKSDRNAQAADAQLKAVLGNNPQMTEEAYALAAEVLAEMTRKHQGNPDAMAKDLEKFSKDPAAFLSQWSPEQREKLKSLAERAPKPTSPHTQPQK